MSAASRPTAPTPGKAAMLRPAALVWLAVTACAARAGEATDLSAAAAQGPRLTAGAVLMTKPTASPSAR
jgi:hypothetical protein